MAKRSEMPHMAEKMTRPTARPGMQWVIRSTQGRQYVGHGIDPDHFDEAVKLLGKVKVAALANRAIGIEEKEVIAPEVKSGKWESAQRKAFDWKPEAVKTRQPKPAPVVTMDGTKKTFTAAEVEAMVKAAGLQVVKA